MQGAQETPQLPLHGLEDGYHVRNGLGTAAATQLPLTNTPQSFAQSQTRFPGLGGYRISERDAEVSRVMQPSEGTYPSGILGKGSVNDNVLQLKHKFWEVLHSVPVLGSVAGWFHKADEQVSSVDAWATTTMAGLLSPKKPWSVTDYQFYAYYKGLQGSVRIWRFLQHYRLNWLLVIALAFYLGNKVQRGRRSIVGRNMMIIGGDTPLGATIGIDLAKRGGRVVLLGTNQPMLEISQRAICQLVPSAEVYIYRVNYASSYDITRVVQRCIDEVGFIWGLIHIPTHHCALKSQTKLRTRDYEAYNMDASAFVWFTRALLGEMTEKREGCIVSVFPSSNIPTPILPGEMHVYATVGGNSKNKKLENEVFPQRQPEEEIPLRYDMRGMLLPYYSAAASIQAATHALQVYTSDIVEAPLDEMNVYSDLTDNDQQILQVETTFYSSVEEVAKSILYAIDFETNTKSRTWLESSMELVYNSFLQFGMSRAKAGHYSSMYLYYVRKLGTFVGDLLPRKRQVGCTCPKTVYEQSSTQTCLPEDLTNYGFQGYRHSTDKDQLSRDSRILQGIEPLQPWEMVSNVERETCRTAVHDQEHPGRDMCWAKYYHNSVDMRGVPTKPSFTYKLGRLSILPSIQQPWIPRSQAMHDMNEYRKMGWVRDPKPQDSQFSPEIRRLSINEAREEVETDHVHAEEEVKKETRKQTSPPGQYSQFVVKKRNT